MAKSTKIEILETLGDLLQTKQLDDITVTELVERCVISRQPFYYHFTVLYGVVDYAIQMLIEELGISDPEDWKKALEQTMTLLQENRTLVLNVYRAYERSYVEHDLRRWATPLVAARVRPAAQRYSVTEDQASFVTELLTQALASIVLSWVERGMPTRVIQRMDDFLALMEGCVDFMLERLAQKGRTN